MEVEETGLGQLTAMLLRQLTVNDEAKILDGIQANERR